MRPTKLGSTLHLELRTDSNWVFEQKNPRFKILAMSFKALYDLLKTTINKVSNF